VNAYETCIYHLRQSKAEDPAGVGVFCLALRKVTIYSKGKKLIISKDGWTGKPMELTEVHPICETFSSWHSQ
jgi:hypothetical protein